MNKVIISPNISFKKYMNDIWQYKRLFYFLAWRDFIVRYKQTLIGITWIVLEPLITMLIFTLVFSRLAKMPTIGNVPYPLLVFSGLLPWTFFSNAISRGSQSIINNKDLVSKVYFPRLIIPTSSILVTLVDFLLSFVILLVMMWCYHYIPTYRVLFVPLFLIIIFIFSFSISLVLSAVMVKYRDIRMLVPFILKIGIYITPVGFISSVVPENLKFWYYLNPMVAVIDGFRWAIIGKGVEIYTVGLINSLVIIVFLFFFSVYFFKKKEPNFADII